MILSMFHPFVAPRPSLRLARSPRGGEAHRARARLGHSRCFGDASHFSLSLNFNTQVYPKLGDQGVFHALERLCDAVYDEPEFGRNARPGENQMKEGNMGNANEHAPQYFIKDGKLTRRTFVKGAGVITVASALGFGAIDKVPQALAEEEAAEVVEAHACCTYNCTSRCFLKGRVENGVLTSVEPGEFPGRPDYGNACLRSMGYAQRIQDTNARVMYPMKRTGERGSGQFERITWEEAIDIIAEKLQAVIDDNPRAASFYSFTGNQGKMTWEACTRFAGAFGGTSWDIEGIMGDHGASMGMQLVYGQTRGGHDTRDYLNSNLIIMWGRNVADTHTQELRYLIEAREKGAKVIVVDPRQCSTAAVADEWIPIRPQTDPALALGMMKYIIFPPFACVPLIRRLDRKMDKNDDATAKITKMK